MNEVDTERRERGASMVEYALLVALVAMVAFFAVQYFGNELSTTYSNIGSGFTNTN